MIARPNPAHRAGLAGRAPGHATAQGENEYCRVMQNDPSVTTPKEIHLEFACFVIPAKAGIRENTGFRIKSGMTYILLH